MSPTSETAGVWRTRLAVGLVSICVIALELALMRALSLRFWNHFAYMVISVALLGFGASGTALTLLQRRIRRRRRVWLCGLLLAFALSVPLSLYAQGQVQLDVQFLAWDLSQAGRVAAMEFLLLVPFLLAGGVVGVALMDRPERIGGHYAANMVGSGLGAVLSVALMHVLTTSGLLTAVAATGFLAAAVIVPWRRLPGAIAAAAVGAVIVACLWMAPYRPGVSQYKMLSLVRNMPDSQVLHQAEGPLGRIDVVAGPAIHHAPGLSLQYLADVPPHVLMILDGDQTSAVYDCRRREDWTFMDYTTSAGAYALRQRPSVCVVGAGGGADIGLAAYHHSGRTVALEMNRHVIEAMRTVLRDRGGRIYDAPGVEVACREARGYFAATDERFDVIQVPPIDAFGASGAGLYATQEAYLYTLEAIGVMLDHLSGRGVLCITRWARMPPRDGLRVFDTAACALRRRGLEPSRHLAMIRSWATVTVLVTAGPIEPDEQDRLRSFCRRRSFDLCCLPGLRRSEANQYHTLDRAHYFEACGALLGPDRDAYLDNYVFSVGATTDDKPYFFHFFGWRSLRMLGGQLGRRSRAFVELGFLMLLAAFAQAVVLAAVLIVLPLVVGLPKARSAGGKTATLGYFLLLGAGFMFLEMGFLHKLILYLAHPIYSAAAAIAGFLVFGGLGSLISGAWPGGVRRTTTLAAGAVVVLAVAYVFGLDGWLALTQGQPLGLRLVVATATIAPLALAMGHLFPLGLRQLAASRPPLVPWAWAVNGFASVAATVAAPLLAMTVGFTLLTVAAIVCYVLAGLLASRLATSAG